MTNDAVYKTRFHHYGAMIEELLQLVRAYNPAVPRQQWIEYIIETNLLGKGSRNWVREVVVGVFYPRLVSGRIPNAWRDIRAMDDLRFDKTIIVAALYYHTMLYDQFIYDFTTTVVFQKYFAGTVYVSSHDVYDFISAQPDSHFNKKWSDYVKRRLSRGVVATLRDFGIMEGKNTKKVTNYYLPIEAFIYISYLIGQRVKTGEKIVDHSDWKLFLLNNKLVERLFLDAHQQKLLSYHAAGAIIRIEFPYKNTEDLIHAVSSRQVKGSGG
mgnify:CR=1 FL=1